MSDQLTEPFVQSIPNATALRWEWRSFARRFSQAEKRFAVLTPTATQDSDEIYFISPSGETVKVRDGLMDIKVLRDVDANGLERWAPEMKREFPLSPLDAQKVLQALRIPVYKFERTSYALKDAVEALGRPGSGVRIVNVHKHRVRYRVDGCMAELTDIAANGIPARTIALESEYPESVLRAVHSLGLDGYINTSYPKGLASIIDETPERYAVIDAGTTSIKFHISELDADGGWRPVVDRAELTRLGQGLAKTGLIGAPALDRAVRAIAGMAAEAKRQNVRAIIAVGTAAFRIAANSREVIAKLHAHTGIRIDVLSSEEEARMAYLAAVAAIDSAAGSIAVFDTGGGSSQFTFGHHGNVSERFSLEVGAARYTELFRLDGLVPLDVLDETFQAIEGDLAPLEGHPIPNLLIGMGGAVTNMTAVALGLAVYEPDRVQGAELTEDEIDRQIDLYRSRTADARRLIVGLQPSRAEVILAGACIARTILRKLRQKSLVVSDRGLRHGLLAERFGAEPGIEGIP